MGLAFWLLAIATVSAGIATLFIRNLFRAALVFAVCLVGLAGLYATLSADFLAGAQILVYIGAVLVLIILAIMLTRNVRQANEPNKLVAPAAIICAALLGFMIAAFNQAKWPLSALPPVEPTTGPLGAALFAEKGYLLAVEITGVMILAAVIGAIALLRERGKK
jgi:NADH-quinone oxidoreductase subunit J